MTRSKPKKEILNHSFSDIMTATVTTPKPDVETLEEKWEKVRKIEEQMVAIDRLSKQF